MAWEVGEIGYIDGYLTYNTLHPKAMVVLGNRVVMCGLNSFDVIEEEGCEEYKKRLESNQPSK